MALFDDETDQVRWNAPTANMKHWLRDAGRLTGGAVCQADGPELADVVVVWREFTVRMPYYGSGQVPTTGSMLDSVNLSGGPALFTQDPVSSTSLQGLTGWSPSGFRSARGIFVTAFVTRRWPLAIPVPSSVTWRVGRWPWSNPDEDVLKAAIGDLVSAAWRRRQSGG